MVAAVEQTKKSETQLLLEDYMKIPLVQVYDSEELSPGDLVLFENYDVHLPKISLHLVTEKDGPNVKSRAMFGMNAQTRSGNPYLALEKILEPESESNKRKWLYFHLTDESFTRSYKVLLTAK
jgi:hypothetical protein